MKYIRRISTGKIFYREHPHTDKTIENASIGSTPIDDLEVVDEPDWTEERYTNEINAQKPYDERRRKSYPAIGDQLDDLYHAGGFSDEMAAKLKAVKAKHPKE